MFNTSSNPEHFFETEYVFISHPGEDSRAVEDFHLTLA
jgi:hypothetical protein